MSLARFMPRWGWIAVLLLGSVLLVAAVACGGGGGGGTPAAKTPAAKATPTATAGGGGATSAEIKMVPTIKFDKSELTIAADTDVPVTADNTDNGIQHNFSVYTDKSASKNLGKTEICRAPCTNTVTLKLAAGKYFFRCDVHTTQMTRTLTVQ